MKCPHCLENFHEKPKQHPLGEDVTSRWSVFIDTCPACEKSVIGIFEEYNFLPLADGSRRYRDKRMWLGYPKAYARAPLGPEVPEVFAQDYREACLTLSDSPKASAALSRRCLQHLLREKAGVKKSDLADEIQQVLDAKQLPSHLAGSLDAIRNVGNFAAHPIKSKSSGEVIEVEPGEAEWTLDVLESLFDYYLVQPALLNRKRQALNAKLQAAGKPPMK